MKRTTALPCLVIVALMTPLGATFAGDDLSSGTRSNSDMSDPGAGAAPQIVVDVKDLNKDPEKFAGQKIMTRGKIERLEGTSAFFLKGSGILRNDIFVVIDRSRASAEAKKRAGTVPILKQGENVKLTGKLEELPAAHIEERYKPGLGAAALEELKDRQPLFVVPPGGIEVES